MLTATGLERNNYWRKPRKVYKLVRPNLTTFGAFQWKINKWYTVDGCGPQCSEGWLHCYTNDILAVLLNPIHANFKKFHLFEAEAYGRIISDGTKLCVQKLRITKKIQKPKINKFDFCLVALLQWSKDEQTTLWLNTMRKEKRYIDECDYPPLGIYSHLKGENYATVLANIMLSININFVEIAQNYR